MRLNTLITFLMLTLMGQAQTMVVHQTDGTTIRIATNDIDSVTFSMEEPEPLPTHKAVDLGLSVLWAETNIGAETPQDFGGYYAWGEVSVKEDYSEDAYLYYRNERYEDIGSNISGTEYDVAHKEWGDGWRMPTVEETEELANKCTWTWTERTDGVVGYTITGTNGNSIFLPAAGYNASNKVIGIGNKGFYWVGTLSEEMESAAYNLNFSGYSGRWSANRSYGMTVRGVKSK